MGAGAFGRHGAFGKLLLFLRHTAAGEPLVVTSSYFSRWSPSDSLVGLADDIMLKESYLMEEAFQRHMLVVVGHAFTQQMAAVEMTSRC